MNSKKSFFKRNWKIQLRKIHYWSTPIVLLPFFLVLGTGILLLLKKDLEWIQPSSAKTSGLPLQVSFEDVLINLKQVDTLKVQSWKDVSRLDVRPKNSLIKIRLKNQYEVQMDGHTGEILKVSFRRSDVIESLHDGSWFFEGAKLGIVLPISILLLVLLVTGLVLFLIPLQKKQKKSVSSLL